MNTAANGDPMGPQYWAQFADEVKRVEVDRNRRDALYGGTDPATWGWRRPTAAELCDEASRAAVTDSGESGP